MHRRNLLFTLFFVSGLTATAQTVGPDEAQATARQFLAAKGVVLAAPSQTLTKSITLASPAAAPAFYVCNNGTDGGFVIVAGDARTEQVLGYATSGHFDYDAAPQQVRAFLDAYAEQVEWARENIPTTDETGQKRAAARTVELQPVAPLLGQIAWDQTWPYNLMTPCYVGTTHSATGCVATAMAQIMYYHRWPAQGKGQKTYKPETLNQTVSVDFSQSVYDWDAMTPTYDATASEASQQAVALLMRDCGVAVDMAYGEQSGSSIEKWLEPLTENFSYDTHLGYLSRNYYTQDEWDAVIRQEIDARRPVFSTGFTYSSGGHAYVFDGYDADGLLHVNWGWSGMSNGYFRTSALTPPTQGTGGSAGGFNYKQGIIVGIQPPTEDAADWLQMVSAERTKATPTEGAKDETATLRLGGRIANYGWQQATCDFGFAFYDAQGQTVQTVVVKENTQLDVDAYFVSLRAADVDLSALAVGDYTVRPVVRPAGSQNWQPVRDFSYAKPNRLRLTVTADGWSFANPADYDLEAEQLTTTKIYKGTTCRVTARVKNQGEITYSGPLAIALYNAADGTLAAQGDDFKYDVAGGESTDVALTSAFSVAAGSYTLALIDENSQPINDPVAVEMLAAPAESASVTMLDQLACRADGTIAQDSLALTAHLQVSSGVFASDLAVYIYDANETAVKGSFDPQFVFAEAGEQPTVHFTGTFENGQPGQTYKAVLLNLTASTYIYPRDLASCLFTLTSTTGIDAVKSDKNDAQPVYSLDGRCVSRTGSLQGLKPGLYIVGGKKRVVR